MHFAALNLKAFVKPGRFLYHPPEEAGNAPGTPRATVPADTAEAAGAASMGHRDRSGDAQRGAPGRAPGCRADSKSRGTPGDGDTSCQRGEALASLTN